MNSQINSSTLSPNKSATVVFLTVGYFISFFLYYIDEGNYHFEGLKNPIEWVFVTMYALIFMGCFWMIYVFLRKTELPLFFEFNDFGSTWDISFTIVAFCYFYLV